MSYGFDTSDEAIKLPAKTKKSVAKPASIAEAAEAGKVLGFVQRDGQSGRKSGPKRTEPQGKVTLTGPQRVISRLQRYCDAQGGTAYWRALEQLLDDAEFETNK